MTTAAAEWVAMHTRERKTYVLYVLCAHYKSWAGSPGRQTTEISFNAIVLRQDIPSHVYRLK